MVLIYLISFQELRQTHPTAQRYSHLAAQLCSLLEAEKLAVVAIVHKSQATSPGMQNRVIN